MVVGGACLTCEKRSRVPCKRSPLVYDKVFSSESLNFPYFIILHTRGWYNFNLQLSFNV